MSNSSSPSTGGISFVGLLTLVFITLKLTGFIAWSWWWVLSPIWISASVTIAIIGIVLILSLIGALFASRR
jgi:hypothetical protein